MRKTSLLFAYRISPALIIAATTLLSSESVHAAPGEGIKFKWESYIWPTTIEDFLLALLEVFIIIATPIVVLFIIYAGFLYVTAKGDASQVQQATRAITYAIIGGILIIGAVAIAGIVSGIVGSFSE